MSSVGSILRSSFAPSESPTESLDIIEEILHWSERLTEDKVRALKEAEQKEDDQGATAEVGRSPVKYDKRTGNSIVRFDEEETLKAYSRVLRKHKILPSHDVYYYQHVQNLTHRCSLSTWRRRIRKAREKLSTVNMEVEEQSLSIDLHSTMSVTFLSNDFSSDDSRQSFSVSDQKAYYRWLLMKSLFRLWRKNSHCFKMKRREILLRWERSHDGRQKKALTYYLGQWKLWISERNRMAMELHHRYVQKDVIKAFESNRKKGAYFKLKYQIAEEHNDRRLKIKFMKLLREATNESVQFTKWCNFRRLKASLRHWQKCWNHQVLCAKRQAKLEGRKKKKRMRLALENWKTEYKRLARCRRYFETKRQKKIVNILHKWNAKSIQKILEEITTRNDSILLTKVLRGWSKFVKRKSQLRVLSNHVSASKIQTRILRAFQVWKASYALGEADKFNEKRQRKRLVRKMVLWKARRKDLAYKGEQLLISVINAFERARINQSFQSWKKIIVWKQNLRAKVKSVLKAYLMKHYFKLWLSFTRDRLRKAKSVLKLLQMAKFSRQAKAWKLWKKTLWCCRSVKEINFKKSAEVKALVFRRWKGVFSRKKKWIAHERYTLLRVHFHILRVYAKDSTRFRCTVLALKKKKQVITWKYCFNRWKWLAVSLQKAQEVYKRQSLAKKFIVMKKKFICNRRLRDLNEKKHLRLLKGSISCWRSELSKNRRSRGHHAASLCKSSMQRWRAAVLLYRRKKRMESHGNIFCKQKAALCLEKIFASWRHDSQKSKNLRRICRRFRSQPVFTRWARLIEIRQKCRVARTHFYRIRCGVYLMAWLNWCKKMSEMMNIARIVMQRYKNQLMKKIFGLWAKQYENEAIINEDKMIISTDHYRDKLQRKIFVGFKLYHPTYGLREKKAKRMRYKLNRKLRASALRHWRNELRVLKYHQERIDALKPLLNTNLRRSCFRSLLFNVWTKRRSRLACGQALMKRLTHCFKTWKLQYFENMRFKSLLALHYRKKLRQHFEALQSYTQLKRQHTRMLSYIEIKRNIRVVSFAFNNWQNRRMSVINERTSLVMKASLEFMRRQMEFKKAHFTAWLCFVRTERITSGLNDIAIQFDIRRCLESYFKKWKFLRNISTRERFAFHVAKKSYVISQKRKHFIGWKKLVQKRLILKAAYDAVDDYRNRSVVGRLFARWRDFFSKTNLVEREMSERLLPFALRKWFYIWKKNIAIGHSRLNILKKAWNLWQVKIDKKRIWREVEESFRLKSMIDDAFSCWKEFVIFSSKSKALSKKRNQLVLIKCFEMWKAKFSAKVSLNIRKVKLVQRMNRREALDTFRHWLKSATLQRLLYAFQIKSAKRKQHILFSNWAVRTEVRQESEKVAVKHHRHVVLHTHFKRFRERYVTNMSNYGLAVYHSTIKIQTRFLDLWVYHINRKIKMDSQYQKKLSVNLKNSLLRRCFQQWKREYIAMNLVSVFQTRKLKKITKKSIKRWHMYASKSSTQRQQTAHANTFRASWLLQKYFTVWLLAKYENRKGDDHPVKHKNSPLTNAQYALKSDPFRNFMNRSVLRDL
eukprot:Nk52_evm130s226 gene=Nk52_evmTU130s226